MSYAIHDQLKRMYYILINIHIFHTHRTITSFIMPFRQYVKILRSYIMVFVVQKAITDDHLMVMEIGQPT